MATSWFVAPILKSVLQETGNINCPFKMHFTFAKLHSRETDDEHGEARDYKNQSKDLSKQDLSLDLLYYVCDSSFRLHFSVIIIE